MGLNCGVYVELNIIFKPNLFAAYYTGDVLWYFALSRIRIVFYLPSAPNFLAIKCNILIIKN